MDEQRPVTSSTEGGAYVGKTLQVTLMLASFVTFVLASYGLGWAILPLITGTALASGLLYGWERFIRTAFTPQKVAKAREKRKDRRWAIVGFALVKYPLVGLLMWFLVRLWDQRQLIAFVSGFILLHVVIVLRAAGSGFRRDTNS